MRYAEFKEHEIQRTCTNEYETPQKYRPHLQKDFCGKCCYCNMPEDLVTVSYHVEHFIPEKVFRGVRDELRTDYNNLMWSCPKCNLSKGDKYEGDIYNDTKIENVLFYDPVETDYNSVFYRNELGGIDSDDLKGREMINMLKLYRPVHNFAWLLERLEKLCGQLEEQQKKEMDLKKRKLLESVAGKVARKCVEIEKLFRAVYRGTKVFQQLDQQLIEPTIPDNSNGKNRISKNLR